MSYIKDECVWEPLVLLTHFAWNSLFTRSLLILALVQIAMKNKKGAKMFLYCYFSFLTLLPFTSQMSCNTLKEENCSVPPGPFFK